jgi:4'-phosphopantetheinyl transferase
LNTSLTSDDKRLPVRVFAGIKLESSGGFATFRLMHESAPPQINWTLPVSNWPDSLSSTATPQANPMVHVWAANLDLSASALEHLAETLSSNESQRASRFHFERDRDRYIAGRGLLRTVLGNYLKTPPAEVPLVYGLNGKPLLQTAGNRTTIHFNLAHSQNLALLAVTYAGQIGIDVEAVRPLSDAHELVDRFFSTRESAAFESVPEAQKPAAFFNLWTRKEAWLKATGEGVGHLLNKVEVSFLPGEPAKLLSLPQDSTSHWTLTDLAPAPGFAAALAVACSTPILSCWRWS